VLNRTGSLDVLAQHLWGTACAGPFRPDDLYREVRSAAAYAGLTRSQFDRIVRFRFDRRICAAGLRALCPPQADVGRRPAPGPPAPRPAVPPQRRDHRRGAHDQDPHWSVGARGARPARPTSVWRHACWAKMEESFIEQLTVGDTFVFAGRSGALRRPAGDRSAGVAQQRSRAQDPSYAGGKFPLSTHLAERVRRMLADERQWAALPTPVRRYGWACRRSAP
jgi:ATP-dependent Lhr-like helicase